MLSNRSRRAIRGELKTLRTMAANTGTDLRELVSVPDSVRAAIVAINDKDMLRDLEWRDAMLEELQ